MTSEFTAQFACNYQCLLNRLKLPGMQPKTIALYSHKAAVRFQLVKLPKNALGKESNLCTTHPLYLALASEPEKRRTNYRELFKYQIEGQLLEDIRIATNQGMVLGNERFTIGIESSTARRMTAKK